MNRDRILVVDDRKEWLDTIEMILSDNYDLFLTRDPDEALEQVGSSFFSLVILDQRLSSDITGVELLVKMLERDRKLRVIILTAYAEVKIAVQSIRSGALDYVSKGEKNLTEELRLRVAHALAESAAEDDVASLIQRGESAELEFKSSARWDLRQNKMNREMEHVIVKTVAAFLNSERGGSLLIGVGDSGMAVGLRHDYQTLRRQDRDGFETFLVNLLLEAYGKEIVPLLRIDFNELDGHEVCRVSAKPSRRPVFVREGNGEQLYVRTGNATRQLSTREAVEYCKLRWG
jgi:FixJ family two-component response regulator